MNTKLVMKIEAKLVKLGEDRYALYTKDHPLEKIPQAVYPWDITKGRLILENCKAIERGYDLDELFDEVDASIDYHEFDFTSFRLGFQKALEIMSDKEFTAEDIAIGRVIPIREDESFDVLLDVLRKKEWDVILDTKKKDKDGCYILVKK